jgi:hypothetical protein
MAARPPYRPYNRRGGKPAGPKPEPKILFQKFFKSVGPRTYVAQVKEAANGNHFLVLTEGKRDEKTNELRKSRVYLYSEDFVAFFRLMKETAIFVKDNPSPPEVKAKRDKVWAKKAEKTASEPVAA